MRGRRRNGARRAWGVGQGHGQSRYGLRRQAKRDAAFPESIWPGCKHLCRFQPKRRRASLAAAVHIGCHARQDTNSRSGPQAGTWLVPVSDVSRTCLVQGGSSLSPNLAGFCAFPAPRPQWTINVHYPIRTGLCHYGSRSHESAHSAESSSIRPVRSGWHSASPAILPGPGPSPELGIGNDRLPSLACAASGTSGSSHSFALPAVLHAPNVAPWIASRQVIPRLCPNTHLGRILSG